MIWRELLISCLFLIGSTCGRCRVTDKNVHLTQGGKQYHFSWLQHPDKQFSWSRGRKYCAERCMDLVSLETADQWQLVRQIVSDHKLEYIWTAGRKCNYQGCDTPSFQPTLENGWFWANSKQRIANPFSGKCAHCDWGPTGSLGKPQPDNRQGVLDGYDEGCLAILNNVYRDGIRWHDIACHHIKPVICAAP